MALTARRGLLERIDHELAASAALPGAPPRAIACGIVALAEGAGASVSERLRPDELAVVGDRALHAVAALALARLEQALGANDEREIEQSGAHAIRSWAALAGRTAYLERLAVPVLGARAELAGELTGRIGLEGVASALTLRAREGGEVGPLLRALASADALPAASRSRASSVRLEVLDAILEPVRRSLDDLATRRPSTDELVAAFAAVRSAWRRSGGDVELEVLAVERLPDFAWDLYRERRLPELARVVEEVAEPGTSLAARIERGEALAWAAPCAQVLVFRAELANRFDAQVALAERAFVVCPTLRNARIVLGDFLLTRAERALDLGASRTSAGTSPRDDVERAAALHPELRRLPKVREKLAGRART